MQANQDALEFKRDIINLLETFFGQDIRKTLDEYYEANKPGELYGVASHMLAAYTDEKIANKLLEKVAGRHPGLKI